VLLQHDNARPHTSNQTQQTIDNLNFTIVPHPPYSPDLAPSDFHLFPKLKEHLKGQRYTSDEEVKAAVLLWCRSQSADFYRDGINKLVHRWKKCVDVAGDYVEK
jgi:histone-lysine N-methyltransferase SETMAR